MRLTFASVALCALASGSIAGNPAMGTDDPHVIRPPSVPKYHNECQMRRIPNTNVWQRADPNCGPAREPDDREYNPPSEGKPDKPEDEYDCAVVSTDTKTDAPADPC